ncbi:hypothetical protein ENSA5_66110 [Enhygromyxa salina]|uniref:AgmX/PglI C-terminal domain-containing protein n=1 Tax=Enhygromyxa salina TaxID=215803 RepID=A0A2S9XBN0_9BACT|nr:AgmX/PglI C-terminal domain-containing protein [Enhygromyxa salina]PRP90267.1 hypothetical protein ENSA5_66110 [Enhygromyxa salina]
MSTEQQNKIMVKMGVVGALVTAGAAAFFFLAAKSDAPPPAEATRGWAGDQVAVEAAPVPSPPSSPAPPPSVEGAGSDDPSAKAGSARAKRMARDLEREQIWSALARKHELEPEAPGSAAPSEAAAAALPKLDPEYIKSAIAEQLVPVAIECYESALEDEPELAGTVVTHFTIIGAEEVGGVVEDATIDEDSTLASPFVRECMRESLIAVTFEPPSDGGRVEVTYPFVFEPEAPDE